MLIAPPEVSFFTFCILYTNILSYTTTKAHKPSAPRSVKRDSCEHRGRALLFIVTLIDFILIKVTLSLLEEILQLSLQ